MSFAVNVSILCPKKNIPFQIVNWLDIQKTQHDGQRGASFSQTLDLPGLRIRVVEYSPGYIADHWCRKGHIVHCLEGELITEQADGTSSKLLPGMTYVVSDELSSHRSITEGKVKLLVNDGDFLKYQP